MPVVRGKAAVRRFMGQLPSEIENKLLRGAARAAANVVAVEARDRSVSSEVSAAIKVRTAREDVLVIAKVQVRGPGAYIAPWLEYGTAPHFISVDDSQRGGMSVRRINKLEKEHGSLVIGGKFVGRTVWHPGAEAHPFLRVSLDLKEGEARAAAQRYINSRVGPSGITGAAEPAGDDE